MDCAFAAGIGKRNSRSRRPHRESMPLPPGIKPVGWTVTHTALSPCWYNNTGLLLSYKPYAAKLSGAFFRLAKGSQVSCSGPLCRQRTKNSNLFSTEEGMPRSINIEPGL